MGRVIKDFNCGKEGEHDEEYGMKITDCSFTYTENNLVKENCVLLTYITTNDRLPDI